MKIVAVAPLPFVFNIPMEREMIEECLEKVNNIFKTPAMD